MAEPETPAVETRDVSPRALWLFGLGFLAFAAGSAVGLLLFFAPDEAWVFHRVAKPDPQLQVSPPADYREFLAVKRAELEDRGWVDEAGGIAEIPIGEAMRLVSQGYRAEADIRVEDCTGAACPAATPTARTIP